MGRNLMLMSVVMLALAACGDSASERADDTTSDSTATSGVSEAVSEGAKVAQEMTTKKKNAWELQIKGSEAEGTIVGSGVMASNFPGGLAKYNFLGGGTMTSMMIEDARKHETGTFDPYNFTIMLRDKQLTCGYSSINEDRSKGGGDLVVEITTEGDGIRGTIEGDLTCGPIQGNGNTEATVSGWFVDS